MAILLRRCSTSWWEGATSVPDSTGSLILDPPGLCPTCLFLPLLPTCSLSWYYTLSISIITFSEFFESCSKLSTEGGFGKPPNLQLVSEVRTDLWGLFPPSLKASLTLGDNSHPALTCFSPAYKPSLILTLVLLLLWPTEVLAEHSG